VVETKKNMKKALSVIDPASGKRVLHEKVVLICHGLNLSPDDEAIDKEFACLIMRTLIPDFSDGIDVEYLFAKSQDADAAAKEMMTLTKKRGLDAFIIPEVQAMVMRVSLGLAFPPSEERPPIVVLVSHDDTDDFKDRFRVDPVAGSFEAMGSPVEMNASGQKAVSRDRKKGAIGPGVPGPTTRGRGKSDANPRKKGPLVWKMTTIGVCALAGFLYYRLLMVLCLMAYSFFWEEAVRESMEKAGVLLGVLCVLFFIIAIVPSLREEWLEIFGWICVAFAIPAFIGSVFLYESTGTGGLQAFVEANSSSVVRISVGLILVFSGTLFVRLKP